MIMPIDTFGQKTFTFYNCKAIMKRTIIYIMLYVYVVK